MKKILKISGYTLLTIFLLIQLKPVDRSNPPEIADSEIPDEVKAILKAKCYDCHSNEAHWPWYSYVAPVSWWVADHVHEARAEVNFSKWDNYSEKKQVQKIEETFDEVLDGDMPIESYLITHPDAKVTEDEFDIIEQWLDGEL
ncbi:MAG: heme-binding domain-containing protein [Verrucomicrobia bacterium]|nr:heme-binding domain-containing protein [Verrucomicrobiota bacterium]